MPRYLVQAVDSAGRVVAENVVADSVQEALVAMEAQGLSVRSIVLAEATDEAAEGSRPAAARSPVAGAESSAASRHSLRPLMERALAAAQPMAPALEVYAEEMPPGSQRRDFLAVCRALREQDVEFALQEADRKAEVWIPLLGAIGETPGETLTRFVREASRTDDLRGQWRSLVSYPAAIFLLACAVLVLISVLVTPSFREIFEDFGLQLPALTQAILDVSHVLTHGPSAAATAAALLAGAPLVAWTAMRLFQRWGYWPGKLADAAKFARYSADLLEGGANLSLATAYAGQATRRPAVRRASRELVSLAALPDDTRPSLTSRRALGNSLIHALSADLPPTGRIRLLRELSLCYADRANRRLSWSHGIVGPLAVMGVGLVVAVVVLALFLPLITLINNLSG